MNKPVNILVSPLEWGLGHAARLVPIIRRLGEMGHNIFIAAGPLHTGFFRSESCDATYIKFPGFSPVYSKYLPQYIMIVLQLPLLLFHAVRDNVRLRRLIRENDIAIVISDNRFGLWSSRVKCVYITHQVIIPFPGYLRILEPLGASLHRQIIKKYTFCFIPDLPGEINLSGRLSHGAELPSNARYTGILSRFTGGSDSGSADPESFPHNTVILSGPEPQRGVLRQKLVAVLKDASPSTVMLEGKPGENEKKQMTGNITFFSHLVAAKMAHLIKSSKSIICRPGYTTIMELASLGCSALLVPTPGQTEQEYLAGYLSERGWFASVNQKDIRGSLPLTGNRSLIDPHLAVMSRELLDRALGELLEEHH